MAEPQSTDPVPLDLEHHYAPNTGTINYVVIFVCFGDDTEFTKQYSVYDSMYNANTPGRIPFTTIIKRPLTAALGPHHA